MEKQNIYESLMAINKEVDAIKKDKKNEQQGFMYRGIDQVMNELHDLFAKHSVIITSEIVNAFREERVNSRGTTLIWSIIDYKFIFTARDGSSISSTARGEAMDSGDKGSNKCLSVALKYVLFSLFLIPTEEMKDPDAEVHELAPTKPTEQKPMPKQSTPKSAPKPEEVAIDLVAIEEEIKAITTKKEMGEYWKANKTLQSNPDFTKLVTTYGSKLTK